MTKPYSNDEIAAITKFLNQYNVDLEQHPMNLFQYLYLECRHSFVGGQCAHCEVRIDEIDLPDTGYTISQ